MTFFGLRSDCKQVVVSSASPEELAEFSRSVHALAERRGFDWDGGFWQRIPGPGRGGTLGHIEPYVTGPLPAFLIMLFVSRTEPGHNGERMAVVESWQTMEAVLEKVTSRLATKKERNPFRFLIGQDVE